MKVCHVIEAAGGGSGQVVVDLARHGLQSGDDVTVIYAPARAEEKFIAALRCMPGLRIVAAPMRRSIGWWDIPAFVRLAWALAWRGRFDIIHGHSSKAGALARLAGLLAPGRKIYTPHGFYSMQHGRGIYGAIEKILSWFCCTVVCVSRGELRHGLRLGIADAKLRLIPNGTTPDLPLSRDEARRRLGFGEDMVVLGFIGRLVEQKNPLRVMGAFARIVAECPAAHMIMVGDGPLRDAVAAERTRLGMEQHVSLLGYRDAREIIPALDCLIGSSDFETLPISFIESLTAGVPIVTTPVGGREEAIVEGETGFAAPDFSTEALSAAIARYLACDPAQRRHMSEKARRHARLYTAEIMGERYRALYQELIGEKH